MSMQQIESVRCFDGQQLRFKHSSKTLHCEMTFSVYLPPQAESEKLPVLYWLSGLTCNDQNFVQKAGAQKYAAELGIIIITPDTSPRGDGVPDDPKGDWDFGLGAGFYVNATQEPWRLHYQMYDYICEELPALANKSLPVDSERCGIFGHSMGGHGALTLGLKNPHKFKTISAFAPISSPINCPWGQKALGNYLGDNRDEWANNDSCELIRKLGDIPQPILVDQGEADNFLEEQLKPELLQQAFNDAKGDFELRLQPGYDHSYFFIASFIGEHLQFHYRHLSDL